MWRDPTSRFHALWSDQGWKARKPGTRACWGEDGDQFFDDAWWGRSCTKRNWYIAESPAAPPLPPTLAARVAAGKRCLIDCNPTGRQIFRRGRSTHLLLTTYPAPNSPPPIFPSITYHLATYSSTGAPPSPPHAPPYRLPLHPGRLTSCRYTGNSGEAASIGRPFPDKGPANKTNKHHFTTPAPGACHPAAASLRVGAIRERLIQDFSSLRAAVARLRLHGCPLVSYLLRTCSGATRWPQTHLF